MGCSPSFGLESIHVFTVGSVGVKSRTLQERVTRTFCEVVREGPAVEQTLQKRQHATLIIANMSLTQLV